MSDDDVSYSASLPGFNLFSVTRQRSLRAPRNSGGISVYVRNGIDVSICLRARTHIWLKIFSGSPNEMLLCVMYIPPENSPYADKTIFETIQNEIADINATYGECQIIITGDLNARTGIAEDSLPNTTVHGESYINDQNPDIFVQRFSCDKEINTYGRSLLNMCKITSLKILNGRCGADRGLGKFTSIHPHGSSVVDYVISTSVLTKKLIHSLLWIDQSRTICP